MLVSNPHAQIDEENYERDRRTAAALRANPALVQVARENLQRWLAADITCAPPALKEWADLLNFLAPFELADFLESRTPKAARLRQSSPFVGLPAEDAPPA